MLKALNTAPLLLFVTLSACGSRFEAISNSSTLPVDFGSQLPNPRLDLDICGPLDFTQTEFPSQLSASETKSLALALSITGSFEGHESWDNIANNFDGQGVSLGLMQQNLGQGSLQPLILQLKQLQPSAYASHFSAANLNSLNQMLAAWQGSALATTRSLASIQLFPKKLALSPLDENFEEQNAIQTLDAASNSQSVTWSLSNIYRDDGLQFKADWKKSFQTMADSFAYRNIQLNEANELFQRAQDYAKQFSFSERRFVLLMFDFVVQNGGFNSNHLSSYQTFVRTNPQATQKTRALKLLEIRLTSVRSQFREDVRVRKTAIIEGIGTVHQSPRNLPKEYCYNPLEIVL